MTTTVMRNGIDFLMKELRKNINNHDNRNHNNNNKKESVTVIWTLQAVRVHQVVKTYLHKVGRKIIR
jgi:hypothetical protein